MVLKQVGIRSGEKGNYALAVALNEPEKDLIIRLTESCDLVSPEVLPFEIGNALTVMLKKDSLQANEVASSWEIVQQIQYLLIYGVST